MKQVNPIGRTIDDSVKANVTCRCSGGEGGEYVYGYNNAVLGGYGCACTNNVTVEHNVHKGR